MDKVNQAVELAERVVLLRIQLREAEDKLRRLVGGAPAVVKSAKARTGPSVAQRVRDLLHDGQRSLAFGELVDLVGGRPSALAARAALKHLRADKLVRFAGGRYSWNGK